MKQEKKHFIDSTLNKTVSCFKNYLAADNPKEVNLIQWLQSEKYKKEVDLIRSIASKEERNKLKSKLPAITPGGLFSYRSTKNLITPSNLMQVDIDYEANSNLGSFQYLKEVISLIPYVAYCGLSVSGTGYWLLIPIENSKNYREYFLALSNEWKDTVGIQFDQSRKDIAGLRGYSFDPDAYFNHNAETYTNKLINNQKRQDTNSSNYSQSEDIFKFALERIESAGHKFVKGGKHDFIFNFCCILNTYGVPQHGAELWIDNNLLPISQIKSNCIRDVYSRYKNDFGSRNFVPKKNIESRNHLFTPSQPIEEKITFQYLDKILLFLMDHPNEVIHTNQVLEPKNFIEGCKKLIDWEIAKFYNIEITFSNDYKTVKAEKMREYEK